MDEWLRWLTTLAEGTSQACSYRSQESYFRNIQAVKETIQRYEHEQGIQYREKPVHWDSAIVGPIIATVAYLQRALHAAKEGRQAARDLEVDAQVHRREAESEVARLRQELAKAWQTTINATQAAPLLEKLHHNALLTQEQAQIEDPAAANEADRAFIQSLQAQLHNANQQLQQRRADHTPNAADGQIAAQQSWTNEQLEALRAENAELHKSIGRLADERDPAR